MQEIAGMLGAAPKDKEARASISLSLFSAASLTLDDAACN
jgi:hypothetical protein